MTQSNPSQPDASHAVKHSKTQQCKERKAKQEPSRSRIKSSAEQLKELEEIGRATIEHFSKKAKS
ncbi:MAG: hypothetical protein VXZ82_03045 [Planctomycetota bacterium]|nr:hypothetical protein [Planctomycetota bacterium]